MKNILITGSAGFIGFHTAKKYLDEGLNVIGVDNNNDYYDINLKKSRTKILKSYSKFKFVQIDICSKNKLENIFKKYKIDTVVHLAAQAGVRNSIENPDQYFHSNMKGFYNILELARVFKVDHLLFASSSSIYGMNKKYPFDVYDVSDYPISLYAATKKSNEVMAYSYSHLYNIKTTALRFFTVYGPFGRPDMAYFGFTKSILENKKIKIFNNGRMKRDFTYIDDIVRGIYSLSKNSNFNQNHPITLSNAPYRVFNLGNNKPITLNKFIKSIEAACEKKAKKLMMPMQKGDVPITYADIEHTNKFISFKPDTNIEDGIKSFVDWYINYYGERRNVR